MKPLRILAALIALLYLGNGAVMLWDPFRWYAATPGVMETGSFNYHFVVDIGLIYAASAAGFGAWAAWPRLGAGVLALAALWPALHAGFHIWLMATHHMPHGLTLMTEIVGVCAPGLLGLLAAWRAAHLSGRT